MKSSKVTSVSKKMGRTLSVLLVAAMAVTSFPQNALTAYAEGTKKVVSTVSDNDVDDRVSTVSDNDADDRVSTVSDNDADGVVSTVPEKDKDADGVVSTVPEKDKGADDVVSTVSDNDAQTEKSDDESQEQEKESFQVSFDLLGHGEAIEPLTVEAGGSLTDAGSLQPTAEGFCFNGWYKDEQLSEKWDFEKDVVTADITLYAGWEQVTPEQISENSLQSESLPESADAEEAEKEEKKIDKAAAEKDAGSAASVKKSKKINGSVKESFKGSAKTAVVADAEGVEINASGKKKFNASTIKVTGWESKLPYTGEEQTQAVALQTKKSTTYYECGYENGEEEEYEDKKGNIKTRKHKHSKKCGSYKEPQYVFDESDYTVTYSNNVNVGTATVTFTANPDSEWSGSFKKTFKITKIDIPKYVTVTCDEGEISASIVEKNTGKKDEDGEPIMKEVVTKTRTLEDTVPYDKAGATLNFILTSSLGEGEGLEEGKDYTISYKNHKKATKVNKKKVYEEEEDENGKIKKVWTGEYKYVPVTSTMGMAIIKGKGNYSGKLTIKYQIVKDNVE